MSAQKSSEIPAEPARTRRTSPSPQAEVSGAATRGSTAKGSTIKRGTTKGSTTKAATTKGGTTRSNTAKGGTTRSSTAKRSTAKGGTDRSSSARGTAPKSATTRSSSGRVQARSTPPAAATAASAPSPAESVAAPTTAGESPTTTRRSARGTRTSAVQPPEPATASLAGPPGHEPATTRASVRRTGTSRTATSRAARRAAQDAPTPPPRPAGHSAVEALLADYTAEPGSGVHAEHLPIDGTPVPAARTPRTATTLTTRPVYPPAEDIALGVLSVLADRAWRAGSRGIAMATAITMRAADVIRAVSPTFATELADARLAELAERGRAVREERAEAMGAVVTNAITTAATSDAMRQMSVAAIEEATDDVLAVVLPAMLEAVTELETQEKLDELMAGLLLRQLPSALEKTLPGVMMRTATKPAAGLNAFLSGVLPKS